MDRRNFFRLTFSATAGGLLLPSSVWPFRKIFVSAAPQLYTPEVGYSLLQASVPLDYRMEWSETMGMWVAHACVDPQAQSPEEMVYGQVVPAWRAYELRRKV
jgi:hypothetical protein